MRDQAFTRDRQLVFSLMIVMILRKSVKSIQQVLNEVMTWLNVPPVTASAFSQARYQIKHEAFIELNQKAIVRAMYEEGDYRTFWGFRILAIDGSRVTLPDNEGIRKEFGTIPYSNGKTGAIRGERPYAQASVLYDVLNRVALDARFDPARTYEVNQAVSHLKHTQSTDLLLMDRNYPAYRMIAEMVQHSRHFVVRCSARSFKEARQMLKGEGPDSQSVKLKPCHTQIRLIRQLGLPTSVRVRFVRVQLSTGEWEVLVTSLLDEVLYPTPEFQALYYLRWGVETFYGLLKTRLELENFTGQGVEAVRQDFHATVYLSGLESILTDSAQDQLNQKTTRHPQQVNRAVSFHAIKSNLLELLQSDQDTETLCQTLTELFLTNPVSKRQERNPPRKKSSDRSLLDFHKRQRKHCF